MLRLLSNTLFATTIILFLLGYQQFAFPATISGHVVGQDSKPLTEVWAIASSFIKQSNGQLKRVQLGPAKTNIKGIFQLTDAAQGLWRIQLIAATYESESRSILIKDVNRKLEMQINLKPLSILKGTIFDNEGSPLGDIEVNFAFHSSSHLYQGDFTTDENGHFRLYVGRTTTSSVGNNTISNTPNQHSKKLKLSDSNPPNGPSLFTLELHSDTYKPILLPNLTLPEANSRRRLNIKFDPSSSTIIGRVVEQTGKSVEGISIIASRTKQSSHLPVRNRIIEINNDGSFEFSRLESGSYLLHANAPNVILSFPEKIILKNSSTTNVLLKVKVNQRHQSNRILLQLLDSNGNSLINQNGNFYMRQILPESRSSSSVSLRTNSKGQRLIYLPPLEGTYRCYICVDGACHIINIDTKNIPTGPLIIPFGSGLSVVCEITQKGVPTDNSYLHLNVNGERYWQNIGSPKSGFLTISGLEMENYHITATALSDYVYSEYTHGGLHPIKKIGLNRDGPDSGRIVLELPATRSLLGKARNMKGTPVPGATVKLQQQVRDNSGNTFQTMTDHQGFFKFPSIPYATYNLTLSQQSYVTTRTTIDIREDTPSIGSKTSPLTVKLLYRGVGVLNGILLAHDGQPVGDARITVKRLDSPNDIARLKTKKDGSFNITNLVPGTYWISGFESNGNQTDSELIRVKGDAVAKLGEVNFPEPAVINGLLDTNNLTMPDELHVIAGPLGIGNGRVNIVASPNYPLEHSRGQRAALVGPEGRFKFILKPSTYEFVLRQNRGTYAPGKTLTLKSGQTINLRLKLPDSGNIEGFAISLKSGSALKSATITLKDENGNTVRHVETDETGQYHIREIWEGNYSIHCHSKGFAKGVRHDVWVERGETVTADFSLANGATIWGKVTFPAGEVSINFLRYRAMIDVNASYLTTVSPDGTFAIHHVPPGRHLLALFQSGKQVTGKEIIVQESQNQNVTFHILNPIRSPNN